MQDLPKCLLVFTVHLFPALYWNNLLRKQLLSHLSTHPSIIYYALSLNGVITMMNISYY